MKIKLTFRYVLSIVIVAISVVLINIIVLLTLLFNKNITTPSNYNISEFVRNFQQYIEIEDNTHPYISKNGQKLLNGKDAWIQILNENNKEVYSYDKPEEIKDKYNTIEVINGYKYAGGLGDQSQILAGSKNINNTTYTYLIGFPRKNIQKYILITETDTMINYIKYAMIVVLVVDLIMAIIFGYIFSKSLTKPVNNIIDAVDDLHKNNYEVNYTEKGLYSNVLKKLNSLSDKLNENELERKKIDKMKEDWIANISHDIKTPLSSIKGYAEFLEEDYNFSKEDIKSYAGIINNKAEYIKELVDDLNLNIKLKNSKSILKKENVNIVSLVKNLVIDILNDSKYSERYIEFESKDETIIMNLDKLLMQRVINNLLYNALVHNDEDVKILVKIFKEDKTHIVISDNGKGISEKDLKHVFDRYYRGTNTGENHKGSGLGMAIAKEVINAHNGEITINSRLDKGTYIEIII
ncbi:Adaptive-response sensory-kinase SasA [Terrisporobacter petrolearius]|uniref:sensor histidine kinase n=1 Tax=Terrisporobacter petrolearius TaxID=1460447 RepID=UPI003368A78F